MKTTGTLRATVEVKTKDSLRAKGGHENHTKVASQDDDEDHPFVASPKPKPKEEKR